MADITSSTITLNRDQLAIAAYQAQPTHLDPDSLVPGIIVLQEIFGVNAHIRDVTDRIAKLGYVAIAPALYHRLEPGFETGYTADSITIGRQYKQQTDADELLSDIQLTINHLRTNSAVQSSPIGCIGFCFGGHVAYLAATLPDIKVTASFYGAGITTWCPGDGEPTLARTKDISGTIYGFFGMADPSIPPDQVEAIEQALQYHRVDHRIFRYAEADHGFFCDQRSSYNAIAATDAWVHVQSLFSQLFRGRSPLPR